MSAVKATRIVIWEPRTLLEKLEIFAASCINRLKLFKVPIIFAFVKFRQMFNFCRTRHDASRSRDQKTTAKFFEGKDPLPTHYLNQCLQKSLTVAIHKAFLSPDALQTSQSNAHIHKARKHRLNTSEGNNICRAGNTAWFSSTEQQQTTAFHF